MFTKRLYRITYLLALGWGLVGGALVSAKPSSGNSGRVKSGETQRTSERPSPYGDPLSPYRYGAGIALGAGTHGGLSGVMHIDKNRFIQSQLGFALIKGVLSVTGDYALAFPGIMPPVPEIAGYLGAGGILLIGDHYGSLAGDAKKGPVFIGGRGVAGAFMVFVPEGIPLQTFLEIAPGLLIYPYIVPLLSANLGVRYLF